jgi:aminoglycoside phosphotransferase (APT) family kinase protein
MASKVGGPVGSEFKTPQATIFKLVRDATAEIPAKRARIPRGYDNEVYVVTTHEENDYIVRVQHYGDVPFAQEAWALEQARQVGAPVAKVLLVGERVIDGLPRGVMVQEKLPGTPLDELLPALSPEQRAEVFRQTGAALAKIHRIPVGGFYRRHAGGSWDFYDWEGLMQSATRDRTSEAAVLVGAGVPQEQVTATLDLLSRYRAEFTCEQPVLCHGDFHPAHLLADATGNLTGVVDFGDFQGSHPIHDIAYLTLVYPPTPLDALKEGYGSPAWWDGDFPKRLLLHRALLVLGYLAYYLQEEYEDEAQAMTVALRKTLADADALGLTG